MAKAYRLCVGIVTALALCKYCLAEWNSTEERANQTQSPCHHHANTSNCTEEPTTTADTGQWSGHFSKCPKELKHYCVNGECRYIKEQNVPSCRCMQGYVGSRCEYVDIDWLKGEQRQIIIICVIAGLVVFILIIIFICFCSHRRYRLCWSRGRRRREEPRNGTEKLNMIDSCRTQETSTPDSTELPHTDA